MSTSVEGLSLVTVIALIRKEIAETRTEGEPGQDGAPGAKGERGPKGDTGPAGKQGPKGHDGKQGKAGKDGKDGKDGEDGADGVGIANIEQDVDNAIIVTMTDGESYTIEMPLGQSTEVHYKVNGGSGGGGTVDLSGYVKRPVASKRDGTWLVYRETSDGGVKEWAPVTTDLVATNPDILFRDAKGRFKSTDTVPDLKNQLEVNRWFLEQLEEIEDSIDNIPGGGGGGYDDTEIKADLAKETQDRIDGDAQIQTNLDKEEADRKKEDKDLQDQIDAIPPPLNGGDYVKKKGGDSMEGPLNLTAQPGTGSRDTRRVNTLGVYSNSSSSALQLGTATTKVYVGENDTSFNGPIKVSEITDRGNGIKIEAPLKFGQQDELIKIETDSGTTQNINLFGSNTNGEFTTLKFNVLGATWRNAIEFESGSSQGRETVLRIDSNKGLKARNLSMDNTRINSLADPINPDDAVNLRTAESKFAKISGDEFEGPIFGPSVTNLMEYKGEYLLQVANDASASIHDDPNHVDNDVVMVQSRTSETEIEPGVTNRLKVRLGEDVRKYTGETDVVYSLVQPTTGAVQIWQCSSSGFAGGSSNHILNVVAETTEGDWLDPDEPILIWRSGLVVTAYVTMEMLRKALKDYEPPAQSLYKTNVAYNMAHTNRSAILSMRDAIDDNIAPVLKIATEDETYKLTDMFETSTHIAPEEDDPLYHLVNTDFVFFSRMYEGSKKSDTGVIYNNETLDSQRYGNDHLPNGMLFHIPTGKIQEVTGMYVYRPDDVGLPSGVDSYNRAFSPMRGATVVPRQDGSQDLYLWINNPLRTNHPGGLASMPRNEACPLYRIHIPAKESVDNSKPFDNVTKGWTDIRCPAADFTTPDSHPYDNAPKQNKYQYEISPHSFSLIDPKTDVRHYFMMSYNKGSNDKVTFRTFCIEFDPDGDPDKGKISPVRAHSASDNGEYASGLFCKKKDIHDVEKLFMFGSPVGLTELYFTDGSAGRRVPELRNYASYIPLGDRVTSPTEVNAIGQPLIEEKGIVDNWYKNTTGNIQPLSLQPYDPNDRLSNLLIWWQSGYGLCSLNVQDLGSVDRSRETRLENNYQGTNLSAMMIETKDYYMSYIQDASTKNLIRFTTRLPETQSQGSVWFFDYKVDYRFTNAEVGGNEESTLYNDTREYNSNGDLTEQDVFKRPIFEARPNELTGRIEIHCIPIGRKRYPYNTETNSENFSGECVTRVNDVFICTGAKQSHSAITNPRAYLFNPAAGHVQRISNERVDMTSSFASRKHGIVMGTSYGPSGDTPDLGSSIYMIQMQALSNAQTPREKAASLRQLYTLTGNEKMIEDDPETWTLDEPKELSEASLVKSGLEKSESGQ